MSENTGWVPADGIRGLRGIIVRKAGLVEISGSGVGASGAFQRLPLLQSTNSVVPVPFWSAPFSLDEPADVLFQLAFSVFCLNGNGAATFMGFVFSADVDGAVLPDFGVSETSIAAPSSVQTQVVSGLFQTSAPGLGAGPHVLNVFWQSNDVQCALQADPTGNNLRICEV